MFLKFFSSGKISESDAGSLEAPETDDGWSAHPIARARTPEIRKYFALFIMLDDFGRKGIMLKS